MFCNKVLKPNNTNVINEYLAMPASVRTPTGATCEVVLELEANFIDMKKHVEEEEENSLLM